MTVLEEALASYLINDDGLKALIDGRVYPLRIPQGATIPCLTYQRISTPRISTHDSSGSSGDLISPRFQFDVWAETLASTKTIMDTLRAALNGKSGTIGEDPNDLVIGSALAENEQPDYDPDIQLYRGRSDYIIWIQE